MGRIPRLTEVFKLREADLTDYEKGGWTKIDKATGKPVKNVDPKYSKWLELIPLSWEVEDIADGLKKRGLKVWKGTLDHAYNPKHWKLYQGEKGKLPAGDYYGSEQSYDPISPEAKKLVADVVKLLEDPADLHTSSIYDAVYEGEIPGCPQDLFDHVEEWAS